MRRPLRLALATVVSLGTALALAALSSSPFHAHAAPEARARVAFSARPERIEKCRTLSADELANVPVHMRQTVVCEGTTARYRLEIRRDDSLVATALLRGAGLRHARRLYALREVSLPSGASTIDVRLTRVDTVAAREDHARDDHEDHEADERHDGLSRDREEHRLRVADEVPPSLELHETFTLRPREVLLVTYDQSSRRLRAVRGAP